MTTYLFTNFADASLFAKRVALERKGSPRLARSPDGFIVECTFPVDAPVHADQELKPSLSESAEHPSDVSPVPDDISASHALYVNEQKYAATSLEYGEWVISQGIEKSITAEEQWFKVYEPKKVSKDFSNGNSTVERSVGLNTEPIHKLPDVKLAEFGSSNKFNRKTGIYGQLPPYPEQQKGKDESRGNITKRDIKEFREKAEKIIADEAKIRNKALLADMLALDKLNRIRAEKIRERNENLLADRLERKNNLGLVDPTKKQSKEIRNNLTWMVKPSYEGRRGTTICPQCGGDGGVNAGCGKCDGTGWV